MKKIGLITIGQAPRTDVVPEIQPLLSPDTLCIERGALDGLSRNTIATMAPTADTEVLVTRLADGSSVIVSDTAIIPRVQSCIQELETQVSTILLLCTGTFPVFTAKVPLLVPEQLLQHFVAGIADTHFKLGVLTPDEGQIAQQRSRWLNVVADVAIESASPYKDIERVVEAGISLAQQGVHAIVLDCMGYTVEMKQRIREQVHCPVILSRTVLARVAAETA